MEGVEHGHGPGFLENYHNDQLAMAGNCHDGMFS